MRERLKELEGKAPPTLANPAQTSANPARKPANSAYSWQTTPGPLLSCPAASSHASKSHLFEAHLSECLEESEASLEPMGGGVFFPSSKKSRGC